MSTMYKCILCIICIFCICILCICVCHVSVYIVYIMYIRIYEYMNISMYVYMYICIYVHMYICTYVYMYMSMQCVDIIYHYIIHMCVECPFLGTCLAKFDDTKVCTSTTSSSAVCAAALPRTAGLWGRWRSLRHSKSKWEKILGGFRVSRGGEPNNAKNMH
jgi:hypothetical protein